MKAWFIDIIHPSDLPSQDFSAGGINCKMSREALYAFVVVWKWKVPGVDDVYLARFEPLCIVGVSSNVDLRIGNIEDCLGRQVALNSARKSM